MSIYKTECRIDAEVAKELKKEAKRQERSINWIINKAIKDYLKIK